MKADGAVLNASGVWKRISFQALRFDFVRVDGAIKNQFGVCEILSRQIIQKQRPFFPDRWKNPMRYKYLEGELTR